MLYEWIFWLLILPAGAQVDTVRAQHMIGPFASLEECQFAKVTYEKQGFDTTKCTARLK